MKRKFECQQCGHCCQNLLGVTDGKQHGIYLTPEEAEYFPRDEVQPLFRTADKILAYQTVSNVCPNLIDNDGLKACRIYPNRPLVCKAFPVGCDEKERQTVLFNICTYTAKHQDDEWDMASFDDCFRAAREQTNQAATNPKATEMFALNERRWVSL